PKGAPQERRVSHVAFFRNKKWIPALLALRARPSAAFGVRSLRSQSPERRSLRIEDARTVSMKLFRPLYEKAIEWAAKPRADVGLALLSFVGFHLPGRAGNH